MPRDAKSRCPATTTAGNPCQNPAGFRTDHFGVGLCLAHGGNRAIWQDTDNKTLLDKVQKYRDDPEIFDSRTELAVLKAAIQDLLERASEDPGNISVIRTLREYLDTLSKNQERAFKILAAKQFYLTVAQAEQIVRKLGLIWQEEMMHVLEEHPEAEYLLRKIQNSVASRLAYELELPQLMSPEDY